MKRGTTDLCLVLAVDKPSGMTSHDVVSRARRIFGEKRIGHTGTLDPLASGVLPLCVGPATRLDQFLTGHDKSYVVSVVFGAATDTDDCDGEVDEGCACPANGTTKDCYLVPASQVSEVSGQPVGWCANNSKGSLDCVGGEISFWSGVCRGAQPPALVDTCATGDFNCDGLSGNNALEGCMCTNAVQCPTASITTAPYPDPAAIPGLDGNQWITDVAARARATNWT